MMRVFWYSIGEVAAKQAYDICVYTAEEILCNADDSTKCITKGEACGGRVCGASWKVFTESENYKNHTWDKLFAVGKLWFQSTPSVT